MRELIQAMCVTLIATLYSAPALAESLPFGPDGMRQIERQHAGKPFLVILWATDCTPCRRELTLLESFTRDHPEIPVVLVASDDMRVAVNVEGVLSGYDLANVQSWLFADANVERLRYVVDPDWFGEIPRSYFYDSTLHRVGFSGALTGATLDDWLDSLE